MLENMFNEFVTKGEVLDTKLRRNANYSDELVIRKAKIYKYLGDKDDRLQVQVLPELQGIPEDELDNLPKYPPFIKGTVIQGKDHNEDGDSAEFVWVACTPDLQVGYILGKANIFEKSTNPQYEDSYAWMHTKVFLENRRCLPEDFEYSHLDVIRWVSTEDGGSIQALNYMTGDWYLVNTSGSLITCQQKDIQLRVGTPPDPPISGPVEFSLIHMTADKILFKCSNIEFQARDLILSHNGFHACGILGRVPHVDNGVPVIPVSNVHI